MNDLISRRQAIDAVKERYYKYGRFAKIEELIWCIEKLPSAQPTATWLIRKFGDDAQCSNCGKSFKDVYDVDECDKFCRHCGAQIEGMKHGTV